MKVDAYLNFNKGCISVRSRETEDYGKVVAHRRKISIDSPTFVVQAAGRQKVRETKRKNVHAFVRGEWNDEIKIIDGEYVTYDPFKHDKFYCPDIDEYVTEASKASVTRRGVFAKDLIPFGH